MKKSIWFIVLLILANELAAQNIGIGISNPGNKLHVIGNFLLNQPIVSTIAAPTAAQTKNLVNSTTTTFPATDSTGWIYDTGGPAGNYTANVISYAQVNGLNGCVGMEVGIGKIHKHKRAPARHTYSNLRPVAGAIADGIDLAAMNAKLLEKVEELTLHLIALEKLVNQHGLQLESASVK